MQMTNIQINFMPGTYNNIIKLCRATKRQTKPVDDEFLAGEEYDEAAMSAKDDESQANIISPDKAHDSSGDSSDLDKNSLLKGAIGLDVDSTHVTGT